VPPVVYIHAKFEVSSFNRSQNMQRVQKFKRKSRVPFPTPFDLILHFLDSVPRIVLHAKFEVSSFNRSRNMEGVTKFQKQAT